MKSATDSRDVRTERHQDGRDARQARSAPAKSRGAGKCACYGPERADVCTIRVRDNGIGIAESELKSIFSGFYRGHASRDGELGNSGLGLGLSIVHDCIGALKGNVHVESERGKGTTFFIELPFTPPL